MTNLKDFLTKEKRFDFILYLYNKNDDVWSSKAVREGNISRIYLDRIVPTLRQGGFITKESNGQRDIIKLTDKGQKLGKAVDRFNSELEEIQK